VKAAYYGTLSPRHCSTISTMGKRNKGMAKKANKERQAAAAKEQQEALEAQIAQLQIGGESTDAIDTVACNHGFSSYPPGQYLDKFCKAFIDAFSDERVHAEGGYSNAFEVALIATKDLYPDVWVDFDPDHRLSPMLQNWRRSPHSLYTVQRDAFSRMESIFFHGYMLRLPASLRMLLQSDATDKRASTNPK